MKKKMERRTFPFMEARVESEDNKPKIRGYAAVFDKWSVDLCGYREIIRQGAFSNAIGKSDVRALFNHDPNFVLGRNKSGTLSLVEDKKGLAIEISPPDTTLVNDMVLEPMRRKDITQMSFAFKVKDDVWGTENKQNYREILEVEELFDVSPVTYPAYPQTNVGVRSIFSDAGMDYDALASLMIRIQRGLPLLDADIELINSSIEVLSSYLPEPDGAKDSEDEEFAGRKLSVLKKELELVEATL